MATRVYVESLGCKLNQCERDRLAQQFAESGFLVVDQVQEADLCVLNTCAVTHVAAGKSRRRAHQLRRLNPSMWLVATGCYTGISDNGLCADLIVENADKDSLVSRVQAAVRSTDLFAGEKPDGIERSLLTRTRPLVKIQDGCDNDCSYCIVRVLRGRQRSRPRGQVVAEVISLVGQGHREVVLTGVHVGAYGREGGDSLAGLVRAILDQTHAPERLRLSSIEPWDLTPGFFDLWQDARLCRHLHLPLQSGCDATLARMNRRYTTARFADQVAQARAAIPDLAITTDLIVGFPGESEAEFAQSLTFVEQMAFARAHVFPFSPRPGTPAAAMPGQIDPQTRRDRTRQMSQVAQRSSEAFRQRFLGRVLAVLWETRRADGRWSGLTDNYIRVFANSKRALSNTICLVRLLALDASGMRGEWVAGSACS
ncbi:MAG: tRNA (N(6)-L-threonylcarbamoyladenosine(37)-C(2))-methylthiotransferase MtaB [Anaerolineae bacterium]|nr:tRNA (N(6)-L-threonylcarbamoyladenosine(37)-C(2))-methylthiotransferase MtaB [Anaerolineae bacterium]